MNKTMMAALAASAVAAIAAVPAEARQGCGPGFHRGFYGRCRPNAGPGFVPPPAIGVYYPGRGYWYGGRYWVHRYRWGGGWRYR